MDENFVNTARVVLRLWLAVLYIIILTLAIILLIRYLHKKIISSIRNRREKKNEETKSLELDPSYILQLLEDAENKNIQDQIDTHVK
ncbi:Hypothetical predicted protein [Cloeon dipterum]|uniref:Uncharacterized protein n=1 Tax=Cloeon dipterum TaxID=197152 RepID=A0A8S1DHZ7_9INSE|nr:Hypothetical predicted protein [Cloeon dipterum]